MLTFPQPRAFLRRLAVIGLVAAVFGAGLDVTMDHIGDHSRPWLAVLGVAQDPCVPRAVPLGPRIRGQFDVDSSVLRTASGSYAVPAGSVLDAASARACAATADGADRHWLYSGLIPGTTRSQQAMAVRALLDLKLAVQPNGAVVAGWAPDWEYAWPRDSAWVAVALADTGHVGLARRILQFLQHVQAADGTWESRYELDGSGPVRDGRPAELDAVGWVPWAVWSWAEAAGPTSQTRAELAELWPMVARAADADESSIDNDGLPVPSMDYWEDDVEATLGTAAPLLAGLRAA